jgi:hypothetical protein
MVTIEWHFVTNWGLKGVTFPNQFSKMIGW